MMNLKLKDFILQHPEEFPYHYDKQSNEETNLDKFLDDQKKFFQKYNFQKRIFIIKNRKNELFKQKQSMVEHSSYGQPEHPHFFKKANKILECFQTEKPVLKFPVILNYENQILQQDIELNTYDNTKRFLKELDVSKEDRKLKWRQLRENNFNHYKGNPMTYANGVPGYFGEFQIYTLGKQLDQDELMRKRMPTKSSHSQQDFLPVKVHADYFSKYPSNKTDIKVPLNAVHDVQYLPEFNPDEELYQQQQIRGKTTQLKVRSKMAESEQLIIRNKTSQINERQKVFAFKPATNQGNFFEKNFMTKTLNSKSNQNLKQKKPNPKKDYSFDKLERGGAYSRSYME